jgi:hypothetical protein
MTTNHRAVEDNLPHPHRHCRFDALLETYLPVIHKAAHSAASTANPDISGVLLLAGLRGLKEVFHQFSDADQYIPQEAVQQTIYASMRQHLKSSS